jgi:hypothetical protein
MPTTRICSYWAHATTRRNWKDQPGLMQRSSEEDADASFPSDVDASDREDIERGEGAELGIFLRALRWFDVILYRVNGGQFGV